MVQAIEKYDLVAIPVIDSIGRLVGQITVDDVMDEVREQSERDYQLASGLSQDVETDDNVLKQTTARLPWLLIGMIGGIGNSMILGNFDATFAAHPEMALYIPLIGGTGGMSEHNLRQSSYKAWQTVRWMPKTHSSKSPRKQ